MADQTGHAVSAPATAAPALVGRDCDLATLRAVLAAALAGRGSLVLIGGEAGIGKTALAEALLAEAIGQGAQALVGRCYDLAETPPYGPWTEALARAPRADDGPPPPGLATGAGAASLAALFAEVRAFLEDLAIHRPLVLLLEDLHWADPASLDLLRAVARDLVDRPLLLLATYRDDEITPGHRLAALLPALVREARAERLELRPLGADAIGALVTARYGLGAVEHGRLVEYLARRSEGNALFLGELLRTLENTAALRRAGADWALGDLAAVPVPVLLRQVIAGRLARLSDEDRRLLAVAAVLGQEPPFDLWAAVGEAEEGALLATAERAITVRALLATESGVRFAHALIREALYEGTLAPRRQAWHRRAGEALLMTPHPDPDAVAHHLRQADDPRAAEWLVRAGERAWRAYAWLTAAERYEAALALPVVAESDARERVMLLAMLAQLRRYDDPWRGIARLEEAEGLARRVGDRALEASCLFDQGHLRCLADELRRGLAQMAAALPILEALPASERRRLPTLRLLRVAPGERHHRGALVIQLANAGRLAEARDYGAGMFAREPGTTARGLLGLGLMHASLGQPALARRAYADARAAFRAAGEQVEVHRSYTYELDTVAWPYHADRPAVWAPLAARADAVVARAGGAEPRLLPRRGGVRFHILQGAWPREDGPAHGPPEEGWRRCLVARYRGDAAAAWALVAAELPHGPATEPGDCLLLPALSLQQLAVDLALDAGDVPRARAWLAMQDRWLAWSGSVLGRAENRLGWAAYHRATGDLDRARQHAEAAFAHATAPSVSWRRRWDAMARPWVTWKPRSPWPRPAPPPMSAP